MSHYHFAPHTSGRRCSAGPAAWYAQHCNNPAWSDSAHYWGKGCDSCAFCVAGRCVNCTPSRPIRETAQQFPQGCGNWRLAHAPYRDDAARLAEVRDRQREAI